MLRAETIREYREYMRLREEIEEQLEALKLSIIVEMGDDEEVTVDEYRVRYKPVVTTRVDTTAFRKELPELAERFMTTSQVKRFSIA